MVVKFGLFCHLCEQIAVGALVEARAWGREGNQLGQLKYPAGIVVMRTGAVRQWQQLFVLVALAFVSCSFQYGRISGSLQINTKIMNTKPNQDIA